VLIQGKPIAGLRKKRKIDVRVCRTGAIPNFAGRTVWVKLALRTGSAQGGRGAVVKQRRTGRLEKKGMDSSGTVIGRLGEVSSVTGADGLDSIQ